MPPTREFCQASLARSIQESVDQVGGFLISQSKYFWTSLWRSGAWWEPWLRTPILPWPPTFPISPSPPTPSYPSRTPHTPSSSPPPLPSTSPPCSAEIWASLAGEGKPERSSLTLNLLVWREGLWELGGINIIFGLQQRAHSFQYFGYFVLG